jgi:hypothetical protein
VAYKQQVLDLHTQNPEWSTGKLAAEIGCCSAYVRATLRRAGLKTPRSHVPQSELYALGRACVYLNITLKDLLSLKEGRAA